MIEENGTCSSCGSPLRGRTFEGRCLACVAGRLLEVPAAEVDAVAPTAPLEEGIAAPVVGAGGTARYELVEELGSGGMGVVYHARQVAPFRRDVALKVIKPGMDTREVIARFESERQALSLMNHPNVAHVYDAGATVAGHPYFVMELVNGVSLTEYCDRQRLPVERRVRLLVQACRAVHHAHEKGIVHRDLKPSNVLVAEVDDEPSLKVIDFGIAKALSPDSVYDTYRTLAGQLVGTPSYMSPEQVRGSRDTNRASDVFSLGAILYELLVGTVPLAPNENGEGGVSALRESMDGARIIAPSRRFEEFGEEQRRRVADSRGLEPKQLDHRLRRDLDGITMAAIAFDPGERYPTAKAFGMVLSDHLEGNSTHDHPRTASEAEPRRRWRRVAIAAAAITVLLATMGLFGVVWSAVTGGPGEEGRSREGSASVSAQGPREGAPPAGTTTEGASRAIPRERPVSEATEADPGDRVPIRKTNPAISDF